MLFFGLKNLWFRAGVFLVLTLSTVAFVIWMQHNYFITDPFNPALVGTAAYGHNSAGDFKQFLEIISVEYFVLLVVLLPHSFSRFYWLRSLILQFLFGAWLLIMGMSGMHTGGVYLIHLIWLLVVNVIIFVLFVASGAAEFITRNKNRKFTSQ